MAQPQPIEIPRFGGINANHNRALGQPSTGKNFRTVDGALKSRDGSTTVTPPTASGSIKSIHTAAMVTKDTRLLLEEGANLWHRTAPAGSWSKLKDGVLTGTRLSSCRWQTYLILSSGTQAYAYDINAATIADLSGTPPAMEYLAYWKFRIFGWGPSYANPNFVRFCGYDGNGDISKDVWDADLSLDIGGDSGAPVLNFIPFGSGTHAVAFTQKGFKRIYGDAEDDFQIMAGSDIGVYGVRMSQAAGNYIVWVAPDKRIYEYSGTSPVPVSDPIDELLGSETFTSAFTFSFNGLFFLFFPGASTTKVYIYDTTDRKAGPVWYIDIYPAVITAASAHGAYMTVETIHFGSSAGTVFKADSSVSQDFGNAITTEAYLGPINMGAREFWLDSLHLAGDPKSNFSINVYAQCDRKTEVGPYAAAFTSGTPQTKEVKLKQVKGRDIALRLSTTNKVNELQSAVIPAGAWGVW